MNTLTRKDWKRVMQAADRGDVPAQFERGCLCEEGARDATGRLLVASSAEQALRWHLAAAMGDHDAFLTVGLCHLFGWGVPQDWDAARAALNRVVDADPIATFQRSREDATYWLAVVDLLDGRHTPRSVAPIRARLEAANADEDHEQANALLHPIGKRRHMAQRPGRKS